MTAAAETLDIDTTTIGSTEPNERDQTSEHMFWKTLKEGAQHCRDFYVSFQAPLQ